jgi:hypothetical protein
MCDWIFRVFTDANKGARLPSSLIPARKANSPGAVIQISEKSLYSIGGEE